MIARLQGKVVEIEGTTVTIDVGGVGYEVVCSRALLARCIMDVAVILPVYTDVKEDSIRLFGFDTKSEREVFLLLNRVSGLGPRSSMDIVSNVPIRDLLRAIGGGDIHSLMKIKGVGKKKAERIVVELRDLVATMADERALSLREQLVIHRDSSTEMAAASGFALEGDAVAALEVLGFSRRDAEGAVGRAKGVLGIPSEVGELVKEALRHV